jgi:hypothetical protein
MQKLHRLRLNNRGVQLLLVIRLLNDSVLLFGPNSEQPPTDPMGSDRAERILQSVLDEPDALSARRRLDTLTSALDSTSIAGVNNLGLFASHELRAGVPQRPDWDSACATSTPWLSARGGALIEKLGFRTTRAGANAFVLSGGGPRPEAVAVLLQENEAFDAASNRFAVSPVAYGLKMAEQQGVSWLLMVRKGSIRLYPALINLGVGRKGLSETFLELDLDSLDTSSAGYLSLLFSAGALADGGSTYEILDSSVQYAAELSDRLRDKVYEDVVPELSVAVAKQLEGLGHTMDAEGLDLAYQLTLRVFFRMLFQVYADDRRLLPYRQNDRYTRNAIKTVAADLVDDPDLEFDPESTALWDDLAQVWRVIDTGNKTWGVPPYNGGLFSTDPELHPHGALIDQIRIADAVMGPVLRALLLDDTEDGEVGAIDFRSLSVREFGTIYEGLLESSLGLAEVDLTLDAKGTWLPAADGDVVVAAAGEVYFHNTSGQRKGTGSYFTPSFVVEHLLERSLDPALDAHLARVAEMLTNDDEAGAADAFFDFKVADLAMGSGHFLTAAIDHIEAGMAAFLAEDGHHVPGVAKELALLGASAKEALGGAAEEPDPSSLLRRQIARRCVYGLDINPIAVELARVSIWIHTFVRGLPMSSLDHNLVCANSLTGIGSIEEALDVLVPGRKGRATLFDQPIVDALESAQSVLLDISRSPEANLEETRKASRAYRKALKQAETAKLLFDAAVLTRIGREGLVAELEPERIATLAAAPQAQRALEPLMPAHMPVLFPEVFLRDNGGFDVVVGNPPWEELMLDEVKFWLRHSPGLMGKPIAERRRLVARLREDRADLVPALEVEIEGVNQIRRIMLAGPYPGLGTGDVDLYKVFAWRKWQLIREGGLLGAVFPRTLLNAAGNAIWRDRVLSDGSIQITTVVNTGGWVFPSVHGQYSIALVAVEKCLPENGNGDVSLAGPFFDSESFESGRESYGHLDSSVIRSASEGAAFPQLPTGESAGVFAQMRQSPRLSDGVGGAQFQPVREFDATLDRKVFASGEPDGNSWPVYGGASFNLWQPETGETFAWADPEKVQRALSEKRQRQVRLRSSAFYGMPEKWAADPATLPCHSPRIAYRQITNATNTRTVIASLVPGECVITNAAPYFFMRDGSAAHEAFVLGVMSSIPYDWYARRFVELNFNFHIVNATPIPMLDLGNAACRRVVDIAGRLAAKDARFADWAKAVGVPVGSVTTPGEQDDMEGELDALVAHLYGLSRDQIEHIFATFHRGWDYQPRLTAVLEHFDKIEVSK